MDVGFQAAIPASDMASDAFNNDCPGRMVFEHVTNRWGMLILAALGDGPLRFYLLRDRIGGISEKMLSQNLRELVRDGLIERDVEPTAPPRVTYSLTPLGRELAEHLNTLLGWIALRTPEVVAARERHDTKR